MFPLSPAQTDQAREAILAASSRPEVHAAIAALYDDVQKQIDQRRPLCVLSGRCCRFEEFGHRLYVTTLEMGTFLHQLNGHESKPNPDGCPFQINKLCSVHAIRPFGCRIFFCDSTSTQWQQEQYQHFHARLKQLHQQFDVPYFYLEWRQALALISPASAANSF